MPETKELQLLLEENLVLENLRLKLQLAELQRQRASEQLTSYTQALLKKYGAPPGSSIQVVDGRLLVEAPEPCGSSSPTPRS